MKRTASIFILLTSILFIIACGEDRSAEQPFAPVVQTLGYEPEVDADSVFLYGKVLSSPNSRLQECGFNYGNDTLRLKTVAAEPTEEFMAATRPLQPGTYFAASYARNGVGTTHGDTIYFKID